MEHVAFVLKHHLIVDHFPLTLRWSLSSVSGKGFITVATHNFPLSPCWHEAGSGNVAQLVQRHAGRPPRQIWLPGAARDFSLRANFQCRPSYGVHTPPHAIACINIHVHVNDPVVHVGVWWIMEMLKCLVCNVGWVAWLWRSGLSPGKKQPEFLRELPVRQYGYLKKKLFPLMGLAAGLIGLLPNKTLETMLKRPTSKEASQVLLTAMEHTLAPVLSVMVQFCRMLLHACVAKCAWNRGYICHWGHPLLRMPLWCSLYTLYLLACQVELP